MSRQKTNGSTMNSREASQRNPSTAFGPGLATGSPIKGSTTPIIYKGRKIVAASDVARLRQSGGKPSPDVLVKPVTKKRNPKND